MDSIQMTIVLSLVYFAFVVWGYSKNSPSKTLTDVLPEQSDYDYDYDYTEYFPNEQLEDSYEQSGSDCGYVNYFPEFDDEEEFILDNSSSSEPDWSMFTDAEFVTALGEMEDQTPSGLVIPKTTVAVLPDPWTIETEKKVVPVEFEFNKVQLEYQLALPPASLDVVVAKPIANESHVDYDKAEHHLMLSLMTIRQLKAEAKRVKLPRYGKMTKAELLSALKALSV